MLTLFKKPRVIQWSKLKKRVRDLMVPSLERRIDFHLTRYRDGHDHTSRAWITLDGEEIFAAANTVWHREYCAVLRGERQRRAEPEGEFYLLYCQSGYEFHNLDARVMKLLWKREVHEPGEVYAALREYPSLTVVRAVNSPNPLLQALALIDRRLGTRTLAKLVPERFPHSLPRRFFELRLETRHEP